MVEPKVTSFNGQHLFYTTLMFFGQIAFGLMTSMYGPTLVDLSYLFDHSDNQNNPNCTSSISSTNVMANNTRRSDSNSLGSTALFFTFFCGGCITGSLFTFLYKYDRTRPYLNRQLLSAILLIVSSLAHALLPRMANIGLFFTMAYFTGIGLGSFNAVVTTWLIEMWSGGKWLASFLNANQLLYGVGSILSPILVRPFLHGKANQSENETNFTSPVESSIDERRNDLTIPYVISGGMLMLVGILLFIAFFISRYHSNDKESDDEWMMNKNDHIQSKRLLDLCQVNGHSKRITFHAFMLVMFIFYQLSETEYSSYHNTFYQAQNLTAKEAADLQLIGSISYTVGRAAQIIISRFIMSTFILYGHLSLCSLGYVGLYFIPKCGLIQSTKYALWIVDSIVIGYGQSAITPALFCFIDQYTLVDDRHNALYFTSIGLPMLFAPFIIGKYIQTMPMIVVFMAIGPVILSILSFLTVRFMIKNLKN